MKTIIGQAATGELFYKRESLVKNFWNKVQKGNNILISAPRRIGKTSLMLYCKENQEYDYQVIYIITESVNNKNEFFRKLVNEIYSRLSSMNKFSNSVSKLSKSTVIKSIGAKGISIEKQEINYYDEFLNVVKLLELDDSKLLIMIDEFAQTVENIMQDESESNAINFLEANREIRFNPEVKNKIQFVYAGSIGLENIVSHLNAVSTINDLNSFIVKPFSNNDARKYIYDIPLSETDCKFKDEKNINYLFKKIEWLIPYFINILLEEVEEICIESDDFEISKQKIDKAFENALKKRNYFEHWHTRLRKAYKKENYNFSKEILNRISVNGTQDSNEIYDLAKSLGIEENFKDILNSLIYDGYINNNDDSKIYRFNSPLLRMWWKNNVAN